MPTRKTAHNCFCLHPIQLNVIFAGASCYQANRSIICFWRVINFQ
ncbi:hypothetical protein PRUB_b0274 [Pseudoalteromonas rubra]|uniref:Uncharacterized protein n=1 Tax=Pseudoalteromonas rubra TaxID=43658 RepID=A0A8T0BZ37_9GAMM|nr:hypothetical protein PRUB_b0274 [Pseudoalteromonas rubra]